MLALLDGDLHNLLSNATSQLEGALRCTTNTLEMLDAVASLPGTCQPVKVVVRSGSEIASIPCTGRNMGCFNC